MVGVPWRWLLGWRVLRVVCAERELQVPRLRFGMTKLKWLANLGVGYWDGEFWEWLRLRGNCRSLGLRFGMTKFKWLANLGVGYWDGEFWEWLRLRGNCRSLGLRFGMTKFEWLVNLGVGYWD